MVNPTVTIEIKEIGSGPVIKRMRKVRQEAGKLVGAKKRLGQQATKTGKRFKQSGKTVGKFSELMRDLETNAVLALGPLSGVGARVRAIGVLARRGNLAMIAFALGIAAVVAVATLFTAALIKVRLALDPIEGRLRAVTGSALIARLELRRLVDLAFDLGLDLHATAEGFSQLAAAARGTSLEGEGIRKVFEAIAKASAALRLSAEQTGGVIRALEQALTKGILRAEEFNQQLGDRLPGASVLAARALGVTKIAFQKMLVAGEIITEEFLPKLAEELEKVFSAEAQRNAETLQGSVNRLKTAFIKLFDVLEARIGLAEKLAEFFNKMADSVMDMANFFETALVKSRLALEGFEESIVTFELKGILEERKKELVEEFTGLQAALREQIDNIKRLAATDPKIIQDLRKFFGLGLGVKELEDTIKAIGQALAKLETFEVVKKGVIPPPDITKIQEKFDKVVRGAETAGAAMRRALAGDLLGAEFEVSLGKARDILAKFGDKTIVEFARVTGATTQALLDVFGDEKAGPAARAKAFEQILAQVTAKFGGLIQTAKDFKTLGKIFDDTRTPLEKFNIEMKKLIELMGRYPDQIDSIERAMSKLRSNLFKTSEEGKFLKKAFEEIGSSMVDAFADGQNMIEALRDTLNDLLADLLKLLIRLTIINPLINSVFGLKLGGGALPTLGSSGFLEALFGGEDAAGEAAALSAAKIAETTASEGATLALTGLTTAATSASAALAALAASSGAGAGAGPLEFLASLFSASAGTGAGAGAAASGAGLQGGFGGGAGFGVFQTGGQFTVGGPLGTDKSLVQFKATRGERVTVDEDGSGEGKTFIAHFHFPPGTNVREFAESQKQIAAMAANTLATASASNN